MHTYIHTYIHTYSFSRRLEMRLAASYATAIAISCSMTACATGASLRASLVLKSLPLQGRWAAPTWMPSSDLMTYHEAAKIWEPKKLWGLHPWHKRSWSLRWLLREDWGPFSVFLFAHVCVLEALSNLVHTKMESAESSRCAWLLGNDRKLSSLACTMNIHHI